MYFKIRYAEITEDKKPKKSMKDQSEFILNIDSELLVRKTRNVQKTNWQWHSIVQSIDWGSTFEAIYIDRQIDEIA